MTQNVLAQQMRAADIFRNLSANQLVEIALNAERHLYSEGDMIAVKGEPGDYAVVILDGTFRCTDGIGAGKAYTEQLGGIVIGEMGMILDDFEHPASFEATGRVKAMQISRATMMKLMARDPDMAARLVDSVAARLSSMRDALKAIDQVSLKRLPSYAADADASLNA